MKTLIGMVGGGAVVAAWKLSPTYVKVPAVAGAALLAAVELNTDLNQSWFSNQIFAGQGTEGAAKAANPVTILQSLDAGKPVSNYPGVSTRGYGVREAVIG